MEKSIYLDYCATTPVHPLVLETMLPFFKDQFANGSSTQHAAGRYASSAVDLARTQVAELLNCSTDELIFTSGATEAINMALKTVFERYSGVGKHFITCSTEHPAVLNTLEYLESRGAELTILPTTKNGSIDLKELNASIREDTVAIVLMYANNETGVLHPVHEISELARNRQVLFICDATQAVGKIPVDLQSTPIDLLCMSAHKLYGPKGVGALYTRKGRRAAQISKWFHGGGQENGFRAGTLNVPGIVGFGKAAEIAAADIQAESQRLTGLRDLLEESLCIEPETYVNGNLPDGRRLPHISNIRFNHIKAEAIMAKLPQLHLSAGSACTSGSRNPSHVLLAMGLSPDQARSSLRFCLGRPTSREEIETTVRLIKQTVTELRAESPTWELYQGGLL